MRPVNSVLDAAIASERDLLGQRTARAADHERRVREVAIAAGVADVILLALGVSLAVGAFRRERQLEISRRETEQRLNEQLLQAQAALAQTQKMEALGQLTGGVAHDFNNLLHVINNAVAIVHKRLRHDAGEITHYLDMIKRNADRAANITSRLLAFSRQQPLDPRPTDMNKAVAGMAELLRSSVGERVATEVVLESDLWPVALDRNQLEMAILNLAVNARDAIPHSGKLTIKTSNAFLDESYTQSHPEVGAGQYAMISVSDTGLGMSQEVARRAFEPFFTTKEIGRGTGLGLSQVFGFVKQSGGHVNIHSEPGKGTTVKMYFPRLRDATLEQPSQKAPSSNDCTGESILVVEDNEDVRAFTAQVLVELGYRVKVATDGRAAINLLEQLSGNVELLFTDVGLPGGMTGSELANEARRRWPRIKVLYTTGYARNSMLPHEKLDLGVELISKPFTQNSLAAKVRAVLDSSLGAPR
jgi:signal transduction histidine kinase/CheY-like chemotaxis protein